MRIVKLLHKKNTRFIVSNEYEKGVTQIWQIFEETDFLNTS
jgi:hypothetical protein